MQVDTGACVSVIGEHLYKTVLNEVPLSPTHSLHGCAGHPLEVMGDCQVAVAHNGQEAELPVVVVRETSGKFPALFGISWLEKIRVNLEKLFPAKNVNSVLNIVQLLKQKFPKVFSRAPGPIKGHEANIILKPVAVPVFIPHRTVPILILGKVEQELT
jgi:hypothetical protein